MKLKEFWKIMRGKGLLQLQSEIGREDELNREINLEREQMDAQKLDHVDLSAIDIAPNTPALTTCSLRDIAQKPPLHELILRTKDSAGEVVRFYLHCYGKRSPRILGKNQRAYQPMVDVAQLDEHDQIISIAQVLLTRSGRIVFRPVALNRKLIGAASDIQWIPDSIEAMAQYAIWNYVYAVEQFRNRPERFRQTQREGHRHLLMEPMKSVEPLREVKIEQAKPLPEVDQNRNKEPETEEMSGRKMTCPYWTVCGHYRTLKNGKVIWIEPYAKGAKRNDPEYNRPKTYVP